MYTTWDIKKRFNVMEIKCLRHMLRVIRIDAISNEEIGRRRGVQNELVARVDGMDDE